MLKRVAVLTVWYNIKRQHSMQMSKIKRPFSYRHNIIVSHNLNYLSYKQTQTLNINILDIPPQIKMKDCLTTIWQMLLGTDFDTYYENNKKRKPDIILANTEFPILDHHISESQRPHQNNNWSINITITN